jgi:tRNA-specific 2-thiouridylase
MPCPWMDDYQDAKRIAVQLGIEFKMYDFEKQYREK